MVLWHAPGDEGGGGRSKKDCRPKENPAGAGTWGNGEKAKRGKGATPRGRESVRAKEVRNHSGMMTMMMLMVYSALDTL